MPDRDAASVRQNHCLSRLPSHPINTPDASVRRVFLETCAKHVFHDGCVMIQQYPPRWFTLIDVDEEQLAAAQKVLKTETKKGTVNAALRQVTALADRRRDLQRLTSGGLPDLADEDVMHAPWLR